MASVTGERVTIEKMREVTDNFHDVVFGTGLDSEFTRRVVEQANKYEELVMKLLVENERLKVLLPGSFLGRRL